MKEDILTAVRLQMPLSAALDRPPGSQSCAIKVSRSAGKRRLSTWPCQEFGMLELASFSEFSRQRALQRFQLLRAYLEDVQSLEDALWYD
jgi:hypothetical protein